MKMTGIAVSGGFHYKDNTQYVGTWDSSGKPHGEGHLSFSDGMRYSGCFENGKFNGLGVLVFPDGARYEGEFHKGWFHGYGTFWRSDNMRYEGEFRGGQISGLGIMTFNDGTNGFPRHEGFFRNTRLIEPRRCPDIVDRAQKLSFMARNKYFNILYSEN
ncbi:MORN repeat-containing protein 4 homolog [Coccinella septempunctata]|uniref:MORN repeat-containing protein 4 homolog n=1 Tax=Coccinella septempunctata TaxID=41139 RepID=UPI001D08B242|nr:MORN repeat-containing protein 4 homolog [Coccinella septempunctata]